MIEVVKTLEEIETKVTWFKSPYSQNVKTNIGKVLIKLLRELFPNNNAYHKTFN